MTPSMTPESDLAEAGWLTAVEVDPASHSEGLGATRGGEPGEDGWEGYVTVLFSSLADRGHTALADRLAAAGVPDVFDVWIITDGTTVRVHSWGHDYGLRSGTDRLWEEWSTNS